MFCLLKPFKRVDNLSDVKIKLTIYHMGAALVSYLPHVLGHTSYHRPIGQKVVKMQTTSLIDLQTACVAVPCRK